MRLNVLICCYNASVEGVPSILMPPREDVRYVVSHQMSRSYAGRGGDVPESLDRRDVIYAPFVGKGLSANRNHCLDVLRSVVYKSKDSAGDTVGTEPEPCREEICLIADDDVTYCPDSFDRVLAAFTGEVDIAAFRIRTPEGQPPFKNYPDREFAVRKIPLWGGFYFSSVEIAFRLASVGDLRFDEDFGVGAEKWPEGGEEAIFLSDCLRKGLKMKYVPEYVVEHDYMSSGKASKTVRKARMMLEVACRCRGPFSRDAIVGFLRVIYRIVALPFRKL